jgi:hypothetical protein
MGRRVIGIATLDALYRWLCECAAAGEACPSNQDIANRFGMRGASAAAEAMTALVKSGRIRREIVRRKTRIVTIIDSGARLISGVPGMQEGDTMGKRKTNPFRSEQGYAFMREAGPIYGDVVADRAAAEHGSRKLLAALLRYGAPRGGLPGLPHDRFAVACLAHGIAIVRQPDVPARQGRKAA